MDITIIDLIRCDRIIRQGKYTLTELFDVYLYILTIDNNNLKKYINTISVSEYKNDLHFIRSLIERIMFLYEEIEEYEICHELKNKLIVCDEYLKNKTV